MYVYMQNTLRNIYQLVLAFLYPSSTFLIKGDKTSYKTELKVCFSMCIFTCSTNI